MKGMNDLANTSKDYQRKKLEIWLISNTLELLALVFFLITGLSAELRSSLESILNNHFAVFSLYLLIIAAAHFVLFSPFSYLRGYRLEKQYRLTNETFCNWLKDHSKMAAIGWTLGFAAIFCINFLLRHYPSNWWSCAALLLWAGYVLLVQWMPIIILPFFFKIKPLENEELIKQISCLAAKAGIGISGVFEFNMSRKTKAANAAVFGLGSTRRILLADTLLSGFTNDEISAVIAHEMAHQKQRHMLKIIFINLIFLLSFFYVSDAILKWGVGAFRFKELDDVAALPLLALVFTIGSFILLPLINSFMRKMENEADDLSLRWGGNPDAFISMMQKLSDENLADPDPPPLLETFFYSHPSTGKRIAHAISFKHNNVQTNESKY